MPTTEHILSNDTWTQIGEGALLIENKPSQDAYIHFGSQPPETGTTAFHDMYGPSSFSYSGTQKCFARSVDAQSRIIVTEGK